MPPNTFKDLVFTFLDVLNTAVPVLIGLAFLAFFWGLVKFIFRLGGDEKAVADGKRLMFWGVIALFILVSFMSILAFAYRDIGFDQPFGLPTLPTSEQP